MAVTKIHRIHSTLNLALKYVADGAKTGGQTLLSSFACSDDPDIAAYQFSVKGQSSKYQSNTIAHHLIQSFLPGETNAEKAHEIGVKLADQLLGNNYQYLIATHVDKGHIHNHIIFNSVSLSERSHYQSYKKTYYEKIPNFIR